jgi:hypothetical protein
MFKLWIVSDLKFHAATAITSRDVARVSDVSDWSSGVFGVFRLLVRWHFNTESQAPLPYSLYVCRVREVRNYT